MKKEIFDVCQILGSSYFVKIERFCESPYKTYVIDIRDYGIDEFLEKDEKYAVLLENIKKRDYKVELRCCYLENQILTDFGYELLSDKIFKLNKRS
jgi:hypothetical protein